MRHLKAFHIFNVAAEYQSFSIAAEKLCITHGAVSKQIKLLESFLSVELFQRQGRNVLLTDDGELLKGYTIQAFRALSTGIDKLSKDKSSSLDISCEPTLTMRWLMPRISMFYDNYPNTDIRLSTAGGAVKLGMNGLSMAIRRDDFEIDESYRKIKLFDEWVGPVFSPSYWQKVKENLSTVKLIHSSTRLKAWSHWIDISNHGEVFTTNESQEFAHFYFCYQAVTDGLGAAIGSYPLVVDELKRGSLIAPFGFMKSGNHYVLLTLDKSHRSHLENQFLTWIQSVIEECVPPKSEMNGSPFLK